MKPNMEDKERGAEDDSPSEHDQILVPCFVAHYYSRTFIELPLSYSNGLHTAQTDVLKILSETSSPLTLGGED